MSQYLVAGLGNPGPRYQVTRHNVGFLAIDQFADRHRFSLSQEKFNGWFANERISGESVLFAKPLTMMNRSGDSVGPIADYYNLKPADIVVIHDDIDLESGGVRVKIGGGTGGHNGLSDIATKLGSKAFIRIRIGIGRPQQGSVTNHVLGQFGSEELEKMENSLNIVCDTVETILTKGADEAQNRFN